MAPEHIPNRRPGAAPRGPELPELPELPDAMLTGWGRTAPSRAWLWAPERAEDVARQLGAFGGRGVVARGLGRSYGDAAQNAGGTVALTAGLDHILELDVTKGVVTTEAGVSLDTLMRVLIPLGWFPMVVPGTRFVTVGGAIASDVHGKFRLGSFCDYVTRLRLVTPGRGVLDVAKDEQPDVFWATAGGMGLTGVITEATLALQPVETSRMIVDTERTSDIDDCMARMLAGDEEYRYSVAWVDTTAKGGALGRAILTRGNHAALDDIAPRRRAAARTFAPRDLVTTPPWMPGGLLNPLTIRCFNEFWFHRAPRSRRDEVQTMTSFFTPLDGVLGWNRVYGPRGFLQYQFLVPYGAEHVVRAALARIGAAGCASFLTVLKRFEHESPGPLSFPGHGWTLAIDFPAAQRGLAAVLDGLDGLVADAGGRIYLTKDSRLQPELMPVMYPGLPGWREVRAPLDPDGVMRSDLGRRLGLVGEGEAT